MNHTLDVTTAENGSDFDPQQATALLDQSTQRARRTFQSSPPLLIAFRAVVVLGAFGGVWLSVRGQHPYTAPSGWATGVAYALVGIVIGWSGMALKRAAAGLVRA